MHKHEEQDNEIIFLFGFCRFCRISPKGTYRTKLMRPWSINRIFTIPHNYSHFFTAGKYLPLIFINSAKFLDGYKPKSAATDFKITS